MSTPSGFARIRGWLVASQHDYYTQLGVVFQVVSAVVATARGR
ncbi:MAG: hypothetical protein ACLP01_03345 [Solirubrobacteraceae bacterium]